MNSRKIDDAAWADAPILHGFTQYEPVEGLPASQRTEVRVLVTDDAVFFAVEAFEDRPDGIRATLSKRDGFGRTDDYVRFILDTFDDQRRAFVFQVNPLGVQGDGLHGLTNAEDMSHGLMKGNCCARWGRNS